VASLSLIESVPYLGLGLLAGAVADRMNRKKIMAGCDAIAAFLLAVVPVSAALHWLAEAVPIRLAFGLLTISAVIGAGRAGWSCLGSRPLAVVSVTAPADTAAPA
jgi:hypothetical protein